MILMLCVAFCIFAIMGCSKTGKCDVCGQREKLTRYEMVDGSTEWVCRYCKNWCIKMGK